jgi:hypothetical protein
MGYRRYGFRELWEFPRQLPAAFLAAKSAQNVTQTIKLITNLHCFGASNGFSLFKSSH